MCTILSTARVLVHVPEDVTSSSQEPDQTTYLSHDLWWKDVPQGLHILGEANHPWDLSLFVFGRNLCSCYLCCC